MKIIGIALMVLGLLAIVYGGINYSKNHTIFQLGSVSVSATEHKSIPIPAVVGAAVLIGGGALLVIGRRRSRAL